MLISYQQQKAETMFSPKKVLIFFTIRSCQNKRHENNQ